MRTLVSVAKTQLEVGDVVLVDDDTQRPWEATDIIGRRPPRTGETRFMYGNDAQRSREITDIIVMHSARTGETWCMYELTKKGARYSDLVPIEAISSKLAYGWPVPLVDKAAESRDGAMDLDEAIEHAKDVARTCPDSRCAADHARLAEWLRRARGAAKAARWYTSRIRELEAENAKLRELVRYARNELRKAEDELGRDLMNSATVLLGVRMRKLGIEVE